MRSSKLEEIRLTILQNMLAYHPESGERLAWGNPVARAATVRDVDTSPLGARRGLRTQIEVREHESGSHSVLLVTTTDRPGLLTGECVRGCCDGGGSGGVVYERLGMQGLAERAAAVPCGHLRARVAAPCFTALHRISRHTSPLPRCPQTLCGCSRTST